MITSAVRVWAITKEHQGQNPWLLEFMQKIEVKILNAARMGNEGVFFTPTRDINAPNRDYAGCVRIIQEELEKVGYQVVPTAQGVTDCYMISWRP